MAGRRSASRKVGARTAVGGGERDVDGGGGKGDDAANAVGQPGRRTSAEKPDRPGAHGSRFPVVAIGASAGGLEALEELLENMPVDTGMAFVVVTHQHPGHTSLLPELLGKATMMTVVEAADGTRLAPNHVYVDPPGGYLAVLNGTMHRMEADNNEAPKLPIDYFLRSLAEDQKERAICIVLSGTGTDGTLGLKAVKGQSGMAMVQEPQSARYAGMPSSAIGTGLVDYVLPPAAMPAQLLTYVSGPYLAARGVADRPASLPEEPMQKIFVLLRSRTGHDFSAYKRNTLRRRVERRMNVHQIEEPGKYVRYLQENPHEIDILFKELLISVTHFFRDAEAWEALRSPLGALVESRLEDYTFRAWVPGCATGEEAFSVAIALRECMGSATRRLDVQIFGTDLDSAAIEIARVGQYPDGIAVDVSAARLERFFLREDSGYRIRKEVREMAIFAEQNVIKDPPFTKLDLISCRNLLIYLNSELQKKLLPIFHYALKPGGILFLGPSESIGAFNDLFEPLDKRWKIFRRKESPTATRTLPDMPAQPAAGDEGEAPLKAAPPVAKEAQVTTQIERVLLSRFAPASVVVNDRGDIIYIHGRTGMYLEPAPGQPRANILEMAREGLQMELAAAMRQCAAMGTEVLRNGVRVRTNGEFTRINLSVVRLGEPDGLRGLLLVVFAPDARPVREPAAEADRKTAPGDCDRFAQLERELQYMKESHQTTLEELETSNEELKSTNEELQSTNEELQSTNEELETSKEEMQSLNEELTTVNAELQSKVDDLSQANDDMQNLLNSTDIATVFLDDELNIKRFTEQAKEIVMLRQTDVGRPISELASNLEHDDLATDCRKVLRTLAFQETEVRTKQGAWYVMRTMPYRTAENMIDGLVLTFVDINRLKAAERDLAETKELLATELEAVKRLHELSDFAFPERGRQAFLEGVLDAAIIFTQADMGDMQLVDRKSGKLRIVAQRGFDQNWLDHWEGGDRQRGACGTALKEGKRVIVENVAESPLLAGTQSLEVQLRAGVQALQSTPVRSSAGEVVGVITTHFRRPGRPTDGSLRLLDLLSRQACEALQREELMAEVTKRPDETD